MARDLKGFGGRMNCTIHPIKGKDLLPQSDHHPECRAPSGYCFIAGKSFDCLIREIVLILILRF